MSEYILCETCYKDKMALFDTLKDLGFNENMIEVSEQGSNLVGYQNDKRDIKANIIIRKHFLNPASNDIGFKLEEDGSYRAIVSEYDSKVGLGHKITAVKNGGTGQFDQMYAKHVVLKTIGNIYGHQLDSCIIKDNNIHIKVSVSK